MSETIDIETIYRQERQRWLHRGCARLCDGMAKPV
jgi:hypothetical protein